MASNQRIRRSRKTKSTRLIAVAIVLCSAMSCLAPVLYASTDCSRWLAEYKQGVLQRHMARRLHAAKYRLNTLVHKPAPARHYPARHRMGPSESLRHFQIDCGDFPEAPATPPMVARVELPLTPLFAEGEFPQEAPPTLPAYSTTDVSPEMPALIDTPNTPIISTPVALPTPEPSSLILVLTGTLLAGEACRRKRAQAAEIQ